MPPHEGAPVLTTKRLRLRGHRRDDFKNCTALWSDPAVVRYISGKPSTATETWGRLLKYAGLWSLLGYGYWAVEERETGRFVGDVGLADFHRDIEPGFDDAPEVGWVLAAWAHGRGYATEAVTAALAWADQNVAAPRVVCMIDPNNPASLRVAQKCGFTRFADTRYLDSPVVLMERAVKPQA